MGPSRDVPVAELETLVAEVRGTRRQVLGAARPIGDGVSAPTIGDPAPGTERLSVLLREALAAGIVVRDAEAGFVDLVGGDGEATVRCWRSGEARIDHVHPADEGCGRRRPA